MTDAIKAVEAALAKYDAAADECPINRPGRQRFAKVCPKCSATASDDCGLTTNALHTLMTDTRRILSENPS